MTALTWVLVGIGGLLVASLLVGFAAAAILNTVGRQFSELMELDSWSSAPLMEVTDLPVEDQAERASGREYSSSRLA